MTRKAPKENALVRIELGIGGLLGLSVVAFCIFLWMYLFGVWTGQSGLQSTLASGDPREFINAAAKILNPAEKAVNTTATEKALSPDSPTVEAIVGSEVQAPPSTGQSPSPPPVTEPPGETVDESAPSFFAIQVAAFKDEQRALKTIAQWRAREYDAFYLKPDIAGSFYRVLVGRFDSLAEANSLAAKLETSEQNKVFISLVSEGQKRYPASP